MEDTSELYYTTTIAYFYMYSELNIHAHGARHVQCFYCLLVNRITHCYPAFKNSLCSLWCFENSVVFSGPGELLHLSSHTPVNETSACTGHTLLLLIGWHTWTATPATSSHFPPAPLACLSFFFRLLVWIKLSYFISSHRSAQTQLFPPFLSSPCMSCWTVIVAVHWINGK